MKKMTLFIWTMALLVVPTQSWSQQPVLSGDAAWTARMGALDEERNAQAGVAVSIVFDDSGSMNDNRKLPMAKEAFHTWLERAPDNDRFGLTAINAGPLVKLARNDKRQVLAAVDRLRAGGGTPLADTIAAVGKIIRQRRASGTPYERQVMVILTDGEDTSDRGIAGVQQEIRRLRADGVEVIAFGYQGEGDYMKGSATHFFSPENGEDIAKGLNVIGSEIGDTSDVVVDAATRAAMTKVVLPTAMTKIAFAAPDDDANPVGAPTPVETARPFSPFASPSPYPAPANQPTRSQIHNRQVSGWQIVLLIGVFVLVRLFRRRR